MATFQPRVDAEDRARPDLGDDLAVHLGVEDPVEDEEELGAGRVLLDERLALVELDVARSPSRPG